MPLPAAGGARDLVTGCGLRFTLSLPPAVVDGSTSHGGASAGLPGESVLPWWTRCEGGHQPLGVGLFVVAARLSYWTATVILLQVRFMVL